MKIRKRHVALATLVLALGVAVYVNWQISTPDTSSGKKELGKATYVNSNVNATVDEWKSENLSSLTKEQQNYFSAARLERDKTFDKAKELAVEVLELSESDEDDKEEALSQLAYIEKQLINQTSVENIVVAKGFEQCVCALSDNSVTVIVPQNKMTDNSSLIIKDAVADVCNIPFENISIVTV